MRLWAIAHRKLICFLLGAAAVAALPPFDIFPILFISFSGLMLFLGQAQKLREAFSSGYWFGFGFFSFGLSWIGNALLIDAQTLGWLYPIAFVASGAFFGLFSAAAAMISFYFKDVTAKYLGFAAGWTLLEWIRSFILTGFPWNLIGSTLDFNLKLLQGASIFGTYGLSLFVLLSTAAPALWLKERNKKNFITALSLSITPLLILYLYGTIRLHNSPITPSDIHLRIVQPSIPQNLKWNHDSLEKNFQEYLTLSSQAGIETIDMVVWGETASPFPLEYSAKHRQMIADMLPPQTVLATGSLRFQIKDGRNHPQNSMLIINHEGKILASYDKSHLVPFGEYIPFRRFLPQSLRPITNVISDFAAGETGICIKTIQASRNQGRRSIGAGVFRFRNIRFPRNATVPGSLVLRPPRRPHPVVIHLARLRDILRVMCASEHPDLSQYNPLHVIHKNVPPRILWIHILREIKPGHSLPP